MFVFGWFAKCVDGVSEQMPLWACGIAQGLRQSAGWLLLVHLHVLVQSILICVLV